MASLIVVMVEQQSDGQWLAWASEPKLECKGYSQASALRVFAEAITELEEEWEDE